MSWSPPIRAGALLTASLILGWAAVTSRPPDVVASEMWPAGLTAAALLAVRGRWLLLVQVGVLTVAVLSFALGGRPLEFAAVAGMGILAESMMVWAVISDRGRRRPRLIDDEDLGRFLLAVLSGGVVAGLVTGAGGFLLDEPVRLVALATTVGHVSSALVLLPLLVHTDSHAAVAAPVERALQWIGLLGVSVVVFLPNAFPSMVFLVLPLLAWTAWRSSLRDTQLQVVLVAVVSALLTNRGWGPLAEVPGSAVEPGYVNGIVLQTYLIACALVAIPLSLAVGRQLAAISRAEGESDLLRRVIDSAHVAIVGSDGLGRITLFNPGAERVLGYRADELMGQHTSVLHSDDAVREKAAEFGVPADFEQVALRLAEPGHRGEHMRFRRKDGSERVHAMTLSPVHDAPGHVIGYVSSSVDVAEELAARQALLDALDTERRAVERLREVDEVKDTFVSSVSHELRTPITSIVGYLEMLLEGEFGELDGAQEVAVRRVDTNSKRLLSLIDELLTLSRVHEGRAGARLPLDLRDIARTAYDVVAPSWAQRELDARLCLPDVEVPVAGNRELLERVLVNLLGNAAKFTPDGGAVTLSVAGDRTDAVVTVRDTGIGIPAEEQQYLFTRFFRSSLAQRNAIQGSGLGLSIAQAIVQEHDGVMQVESTPGLGTEFQVFLPLDHQQRNVRDSTSVGAGDA